MQKKLLALLLSFSLLASLFAIVPVSVSAEEAETPATYGLVSDDDESETPYADISSISAERALLNSSTVGTIYGFDSTGQVGSKTGTSAIQNMDELTNADYAQTTIYAKNSGIGGTKEEGEYFILVADIGYVADIDTIAVYNRISAGNNAAYRLRDFDFLALNSLDDMATAQALATYTVANDTDTAKMRHILRLQNPVRARYVALRIRDWGTNSALNAYFEINAYGEEYVAPFTLISDQTNTNYTAAEIGEGDFLGNVDDTEIYVRAYEEDGTLAKEYVGFGTGKVDEAKSYVLGTGTATASNFAFIRSSDGYDYFDAIIDLGSTKNISAMLVNSYISASGTNTLRRLRKFDFLAVNSLDDLATAEAMASFDVANDANKTTYTTGGVTYDVPSSRHLLKIANPVAARYAVIRIYEWQDETAVTNGLLTSSLYGRFSFNAFGTSHECTLAEVVDDKYLVLAASCESAAIYYKSCSVCGVASTETFTYGTAAHTFDQQVTTEDYLASAATSEAAATYYYSCTCGEKGTETFSYGEPLEAYTLISDQTNTNYTAAEIGEGDFLGNVDDTEIYVRAYEEDGTLAKEYVGFGTGKVDEEKSYVLGTGTATASSFAFIRSSDGYDYFDAIIDLGSTKNISAMLVNSWVGNTATVNGLRRLRRFDFLAVNSLDDLATAEAMASYDVANDTNKGTYTTGGVTYNIPSSRHLLKIANPVAARYAVIRIYEWQDETAVTNGLLTSSLYGRFSFNAFGTAVDSGEDEHTCVFDKEIATEDYLAEAATCTTAAKYYYSCECGEKGTETFTYGDVDATEHSGTLVTDEAVAATCKEGGLEEGSHWDCCNAIEVAQEPTEIDPSNHVDAEPVIDEAVAATCKEGGLKEGSHWACCNATEVAQEPTEVDPSNHVDEEPVVDAAVAATCKEGGLKEGSHWACCDAIEVAQEPTEIDPSNHVDAEPVIDEAVAATCKEGGLKEGSHWNCCNATEVAQEPTEVDPSNHVNPVPVEDPAVAATKDAPGKTAGTKYECCGVAAEVGATTYYVEFVCDGTVVYTTEVVEGATLSPDDLAAVEAAKFTGVGYIFAGWDNPIEGAITGTTTFTATYERDTNTQYRVTVNGSDAVEYAFDTKITVKTANEEEALWTVNGEKYDIGAVAVFYSFGEMAIVAEEITDPTIKETPFVSILKTFTENGEYVAIIHAYAAGQEISEIGAYYVNGNYVNDFAAASKQKKLSVNSGSADAMTTLYGIKSGKTRAVKAYAIIGGQEITSDAQSASF